MMDVLCGGGMHAYTRPLGMSESALPPEWPLDGQRCQCGAATFDKAAALACCCQGSASGAVPAAADGTTSAHGGVAAPAATEAEQLADDLADALRYIADGQPVIPADYARGVLRRYGLDGGPEHASLDEIGVPRVNAQGEILTVHGRLELLAASREMVPFTRYERCWFEALDRACGYYRRNLREIINHTSDDNHELALTKIRVHAEEAIRAADGALAAAGVEPGS